MAQDKCRWPKCESGPDLVVSSEAFLLEHPQCFGIHRFEINWPKPSICPSFSHRHAMLLRDPSFIPRVPPSPLGSAAAVHARSAVAIALCPPATSAPPRSLCRVALRVQARSIMVVSRSHRRKNRRAGPSVKAGPHFCGTSRPYYPTVSFSRPHSPS